MPRKVFRLAIISVTILILIVICGCSSSQQTETDWSQQVAASIDGHDITEADVNTFIDRFRRMSNLKTDTAWATYLDEQGVTTSQFRDGAIEQLEEDYAVRKVSEDDNLTVSDDEIDTRIKEARQAAGYADDDDGWEAFLSDVGYTKDEYRHDIETSLMRQKYAKENAIAVTPSTSQLLNYAMSTGRYSGKKVYAGTFTRRRDAVSAREQMTDGMSVTEFLGIVTNMNGTTSEIGWSGLSSMTESMTQSIADIGPGQVSEVTASTNGYSIYYVEQQVIADDDGRIDVSVLPQDLYERLVSDTSAYYSTDAEQEALSRLVQSFSPTQNDMPDELPYDIDIEANSTYSPDANENADDGDETDMNEADE